MNEIRKLINVEEKYVDLTGNPNFDYTGTAVYLSGLSQGDTVSTREGNSIKIQKIKFNYNLVWSTGLTQARVLIVRDLQNQGATITCNDVLESTGNVYAPLSMIDYINGPLQNKRFSIVYDNMTTLDQYHPVKSFQFESSHDCHVYFRDTGSTVASAGNGSYFLLIISNVLASTPNINFYWRMEFTDN